MHIKNYFINVIKICMSKSQLPDAAPYMLELEDKSNSYSQFVYSDAVVPFTYKLPAFFVIDTIFTLHLLYPAL